MSQVAWSSGVYVRDFRVRMWPGASAGYVAFEPFRVAGLPRFEGFEIHERRPSAPGRKFRVCLSPEEAHPFDVYDPSADISTWAGQKTWHSPDDPSLYGAIASWRSRSLQVVVRIDPDALPAELTGVSVGCHIQGIDLRDYAGRSALVKKICGIRQTLLRYADVGSDGRSFAIPTGLHLPDVESWTIRSPGDRRIADRAAKLLTDRLLVDRAVPPGTYQIDISLKLGATYLDSDRQFHQVSVLPSAVVVPAGEDRVALRTVAGSIRCGVGEFLEVHVGTTFNARFRIVAFGANAGEAAAIAETIAGQIECPLALPLFGAIAPVRLLDYPRPLADLGNLDISPRASAFEVAIDKLPAAVTVLRSP